jgi:hypothetical protein
MLTFEPFYKSDKMNKNFQNEIRKLLSMKAFCEKAEEASIWLEELSKRKQKLTPSAKKKYNLFRFEKKQSGTQKKNLPEQFKYTIFFKSPKVVPWEKLRENISNQMDSFFKSYRSPISKESIDNTLKQLHKTLDIYLQREGPYSSMDLMLEGIYRSEITETFKKFSPPKNKVSTFDISKVKTAFLKQLEKIDRKKILSAKTQSAENISRNEMFAYTLSSYLDYHLVPPCTLSTFTIDEEEMVGHAQLYLSAGVNAAKIMDLSAKQREQFIQKIQKESIDKNIIFSSLLFHCDASSQNYHFMTNGHVTLLNNQLIMPHSNINEDNARQANCWLLAFPQTNYEINKKLLYSITKWNEKEILNIATKFYPQKTTGNQRIIAAFQERIASIKQLCSSSLASNRTLTTKEFFFYLFPKYHQQWNFLRSKNFPIATTASLAGFIPKKILSRLQDFTLQEWPSLASSLNTHEEAFFTVKEEALYEK